MTAWSALANDTDPFKIRIVDTANSRRSRVPLFGLCHRPRQQPGRERAWRRQLHVRQRVRTGGRHPVIRIGDLALETAAPDDLGGRLRALTGLSVAEMHRQLGGFPIASTVAAALLPFLVAPMERSDLAGIIAANGVRATGKAVQALYAAALEGGDAAAPLSDALTVELFCDRYIAGEGRDDPAMLQFQVNNGEAIEAEFARRNEAAAAAPPPPPPPKKAKRK
jgi:hypothetical protein